MSKLVDDFSSAVNIQEQQAIIKQVKRLMNDKRISNDLQNKLNSYFNFDYIDDPSRILKESNDDFVVDPLDDYLSDLEK